MSDFHAVCSVDDLIANSGVTALVEDVQVALFYLDEQVFALNNFDPIGKANVMSRGMVGDLKGEFMVASPLMKQHYNLKTGECMDVEGVSIPTYEVKIDNKQVMIKL